MLKRSKSDSRGNNTLALSLILVAALLCYWNSLNVPFVLDDITSIVTNKTVISFNIPFKSRLTGDLSFALNYRLHGFWLPGFHFVNLLLHIFNGLLLYRLMLILCSCPELSEHIDPVIRQTIPVTAALIFVCHPLQSQSVTYLAQRVTLLAAMFSFATIIGYLKVRMSTDTPAKLLWLAGSLFTISLAILSKENAVVIFPLILLIEFLFFPTGRERFLPLFYLLPLLILVLLLFVFPGLQGGIWPALTAFTAESGAAGRLDYLLSQIPVLVKYLRLFMLPVGQSLDHDPKLYTTIADPMVGSYLLFLISLVIIAILLVRSRRSWLLLSGFGILWFFLSVWVESGAVPLRDLMSEQRVYLPMAGLSCSTAVLLCRIASRQLQIAGIAMMILILSALTINRNRVWQSEVSIWEDVTRKSPEKGRGFGALGHALQRAGDVRKAEAAYRKAIELNPNDHIARINLGALYLDARRYAESISCFNEAARLSPQTAAIWFNLGIAYAGLGRLNEAESAFVETIRLQPDFKGAAGNLESVRRAMGR